MRPLQCGGRWALPRCVGRWPRKANIKWRIAQPFSTAPGAGAETHRVACGSSGFVTVDIYNSHALTSKTTPLIIHLPPTGTHLRAKHPPIPAYLLSDAFRAYPLASINYRWNHVPHVAQVDAGDELSPLHDPAPLASSPGYENYPFPIPLHDTLHAFTWITEQLLPSLSQTQELKYPPPPPSPYATAPISTKSASRPLIIYGSRLGGTLAASLGLTETRVSRLTNRIAGIIVQDGIFDWTGIATSRPKNLPEIDMTSPTNIRDGEIWAYISNETPLSPPPTPSSAVFLGDARKTNPTSKTGLDILATSPHLPTTADLHEMKSHLFARPASCFDSFASPILFFRAPGFSIPRVFPGTKPASAPPSSDLAGLSLSEAERADLRAMVGAEEDAASSAKAADAKGADEEIEILRKSMLKFPQSGSGLKIPRALFLVGANKPGDKDAELPRQAEELAKLMRRSVLLHECKDRAAWDPDLDPERAADERVQMHRLASSSSFPSTAGSLSESEREAADVVGSWMEEMDQV